MSKNSNRSFMGTLALLALMSVLLAKVFSELAFAEPPVDPATVTQAAPAKPILPLPELDAPAQNLGTYEVHQIVNSDNGRMCRDKHDQPLATPGDDKCGAKVQVVRNADQIAFFEPRTDERDTYITTFMLYGELWNSHCDGSIQLADAKAGLFTSKLCRAFHAKKLDTRKNETFIFNDKTDVLDPVVSVALGITTTSGFRISVPKGDTPPQNITMVKSVSGTVLLFLSGSFTDTYTLTRIGD